jgi:hypothetical protein
MLKKQSNKNKIIVACAGSGKTTYIVEEALKLKDKKVLIVTYTNENLDQVKLTFIEKNGCIPANVFILSWFSFLLQECARPYQNHMNQRSRIRSIYFFKGTQEDKKLKEGLKYQPEAQDGHYLTNNDYLYDDKVSKFVYKCNQCSNGLIIKRLEKVYDHIFIDELQDLAGYDLNLLEIFLQSAINIVGVGDPRQATYSTNQSQKNKRYKKSGIYLWLKEKNKKGEVKIEEQSVCYRSNQKICDFADALFPDLPKTISKNNLTTGHDGIFYILPDKVNDYIKKHRPTILRHNKRKNTLNLSAINIGISKGRTYNRVLIFPTEPMLEYLKTKDPSKVGDKSKLYVAVTRARYSVAFVMNN